MPFACFRRRQRSPSLREVISCPYKFSIREVLAAVVESIVTLTERLQTSVTKLDKVLGEVGAAKNEIAGLKTEVQTLNEIIAGLQAGTITPAQLEALGQAATAIESRTDTLDAQFPDLAVPGASPVEGSPEPGSPTDPSPAPTPFR